ncbi:MAG: hypothetical protein AAGD14_07935 [Planctomycetota bacterium]
MIAALAAALLFAAGVLVGRTGEEILPTASAQDNAGGLPVNNPNGPAAQNGPGVTITQDPLAPLKSRVTTTGPTASDSNSNNRFVSVTSPVGSGESVLFLIDSKKEQVAVYKFNRNKGLRFLAARKIDYDLRIHGYQDESEFTRDELRTQYDKQIARDAAKAAKNR